MSSEAPICHYSLHFYITIYIPYKIDKNASKRYVLANNLNLRYSQSTASPANIIKEIPYGTKVLVYSEDSLWAKVKVNGVEGYMGLPFRYLADKKTFYETDGIYGNIEARDIIKSSYVKRAIVDYLSNNNYSGLIPDNVQLELYGEIRNVPIWQVFGYDKDAEFNIFGGSKLTGTDEWCAVIIMSNLQKNQKKILIFSYNDQDIASLIYEDDFPPDYDGIKIVSSKRVNKIIGRNSIPYSVPVIIYGVNDVFSELKQKALFYDGSNFNFKELTKPVIILNND